VFDPETKKNYNTLAIFGFICQDIRKESSENDWQLETEAKLLLCQVFFLLFSFFYSLTGGL